MDGQSQLLLIRDEGGPPEAQVSPAPQSAHPQEDARRNRVMSQQHLVCQTE